MRKITLIVWAAAIVLMASEVASAQEFCIATTLTGGATRNFKAIFMVANADGPTALLSVQDTASVNAIGFGSFNVTSAFLAPITLAWSIIADGVTENYDCRLFTPTSGAGNQLTIRNVGTTRIQLTSCIIKPLPC